MNIYLIIGLIIVGILIFFMMNRKKNNSINTAKPDLKITDQGVQIQADGSLEDILGYDLKDEAKIREQLPNMSIQEMAKYADKVTKENAKNEDFLKAQLPDGLVNKLKEVTLDDKIKKMMLSPTTFGNSAYVVINSPEPYKSRAKGAIDYLMTLI